MVSISKFKRKRRNNHNERTRVSSPKPLNSGLPSFLYWDKCHLDSDRWSLSWCSYSEAGIPWIMDKPAKKTCKLQTLQPSLNVDPWIRRFSKEWAFWGIVGKFCWHLDPDCVKLTFLEVLLMRWLWRTEFDCTRAPVSSFGQLVGISVSKDKQLPPMHVFGILGNS